MSPLVTSQRMYAAVPGAARAWRALFERVFADAAVEVRFLEHGWPQPIDALWREPGLACAFMCGWPFSRQDRGMQPIAMPVPSPPRYQGLARYCSEFLARDDTGWARLEDSFGHRIGWMARDSQSGFNAPRAHLARFATRERPALYRESRGPLGTPLRTLEALRAGDVDVVALDGFFLDLLRRHEPGLLAGIRCLDATPWAPIPLLVAAPDVDPAVVERLRAHLLALHDRPECAPLLQDVIVECFTAPAPQDYAEFDAMAEFAAERGYHDIR
ncbi:MAG TPA: PhnD/SsuA/transferrin family substrate-binding protein [Myxococcota bacterium]|nr:PhnD/SsuA/transferrin family substrate-binding protein [Myxococcota bacterium]